LTIPAFGPSGSVLSTAPGWFSDQTVHTVTMPWTTLHPSPIGDAMCASKTSTRTRRTHTFVQGLLAHATSAASAFQKASSRHIGSHVRRSFAVLAAREKSKTWSSIAKNVLVHPRNTRTSVPNAGNTSTRTSSKNILRLASIGTAGTA
jgi:hypothetical protein